MRKLILNLLPVLACLQLSAQNLSNPYASIGKKAPKIATVTNGEYEEFFKQDTLVQIGTTIMNRFTGEVAFFAEDNSEKFKQFTEHNEKNFRFLSQDPLTKSYPMLTPYQFASNSPIAGVDMDGLEFYYAANGSLIGKIGTSTEVRVVDAKDVKSVSGYCIWANGTKEPKYAEYATNQANQFSTALGVNNEQLVAFASVINAESGGGKEESYAIGNVTENFIGEGGSSQLNTLDDVTMYDNSFAQGATQEGYTEFKGKTAKEQNSKFALGAAINAIGFSKGLKGFTDASGGADSWDGKDLISTKYSNSHRGYSWSAGSKDLLSTYKKDNNGGVDVSKWTYKKTGYQIEATKIIGKTLFTNVQGGRGEKKQSTVKFK